MANKTLASAQHSVDALTEPEIVPKAISKDPVTDISKAPEPVSNPSTSALAESNPYSEPKISSQQNIIAENEQKEKSNIFLSDLALNIAAKSLESAQKSVEALAQTEGLQKLVSNQALQNSQEEQQPTTIIPNNTVLEQTETSQGSHVPLSELALNIASKSLEAAQKSVDALHNPIQNFPSHHSLNQLVDEKKPISKAISEQQISQLKSEQNESIAVVRKSASHLSMTSAAENVECIPKAKSEQQLLPQQTDTAPQLSLSELALDIASKSLSSAQKSVEALSQNQIKNKASQDQLLGASELALTLASSSIQSAQKSVEALAASDSSNTAAIEEAKSYGISEFALNLASDTLESAQKSLGNISSSEVSRSSNVKTSHSEIQIEKDDKAHTESAMSETHRHVQEKPGLSELALDLAFKSLESAQKSVEKISPNDQSLELEQSSKKIKSEPNLAPAVKKEGQSELSALALNLASLSIKSASNSKAKLSSNSDLKERSLSQKIKGSFEALSRRLTGDKLAKNEDRQSVQALKAKSSSLNQLTNKSKETLSNVTKEIAAEKAPNKEFIETTDEKPTEDALVHRAEEVTQASDEFEENQSSQQEASHHSAHIGSQKISVADLHKSQSESFDDFEYQEQAQEHVADDLSVNELGSAFEQAEILDTKNEKRDKIAKKSKDDFPPKTTSLSPYKAPLPKRPKSAAPLSRPKSAAPSQLRPPLPTKVAQKASPVTRPKTALAGPRSFSPAERPKSAASKLSTMTDSTLKRPRTASV
jgi:hypothetical protein